MTGYCISNFEVLLALWGSGLIITYISVPDIVHDLVEGVSSGDEGYLLLPEVEFEEPCDSVWVQDFSQINFIAWKNIYLEKC